MVREDLCRPNMPMSSSAQTKPWHLMGLAPSLRGGKMTGKTEGVGQTKEILYA